MSISTTGADCVALFDTTNGQTIGGPLFESNDDAEEFIQWAGDRLLGPHPDRYPTAAELVVLQQEWLDGRE